MASKIKSIKYVVVGDSNVGKTSMLATYTTNQFPAEYVPTVFENFFANVVIQDRVVQQCFWDTAGQEYYTRLRVLSYDETDVFLVVFSLVDRASFAHVSEIWAPEVKHYCPTAEIILVGSKSDLVEDPITLEKMRQNNEVPVDRNEAMKKAAEIGAFAYCECSALTQRGLKETFELATESVLRYDVMVQPSRSLRRSLSASSASKSAIWSKVRSLKRATSTGAVSEIVSSEKKSPSNSNQTKCAIM